MEKVYVENEWYDGPRKGIADLNGMPHRFISNFNDEEGYLESFKIFPIPTKEFELEVEQWKIFVDWNKKYEAGEVEADSHPGHGGISQRWDEIDKILKTKRDYIPDNAISASATFERIDQENRYETTGPCYAVVWIFD